MQLFKNAQAWWNDRNFIQKFEAVINAEKQKLARMNQTLQEFEVTSRNPLSDDETRQKALAELAEDGALKTEIKALTQRIGYLEHLLINYRTTHGLGETSLIQKEIDEHKPEASPPVKPVAQLPVAPEPPAAKLIKPSGLVPDANRFNMGPLIKWLFSNSKSVIQNFENLLLEKEAALKALDNPPAPVEEKNGRELEALERVVDNEFLRKRLNEEIRTIQALLYQYQKTPSEDVLKRIEEILYREKPDLRPPAASEAPPPAKPAAAKIPESPPAKPAAPKLIKPVGREVKLAPDTIGIIYNQPRQTTSNITFSAKAATDDVWKKAIAELKASDPQGFAKNFTIPRARNDQDVFNILKALHEVDEHYSGKIDIFVKERNSWLSEKEIQEKREAIAQASRGPAP